MSVIEKSGVMKYKDKDGQVYIMLPITTADKVDGAVSFYEQELTEEEKAQARANIGAISADEVPESGGSEQIQSDYDQNDSTTVDFIKNRPFYEIAGETIFDGDVEVAMDNPDTGGYIDGHAEGDNITIASIQTGDMVKVVIDSKTYMCEARIEEYEDGNGILLGNEAVPTKQMCDQMGVNFEEVFPDVVDTGEPFFIEIADGTFYVVTPEPGTYHFTISKGELKQLDEKFIPDTIARVSDIPTGGADIDLTNIPNLYTWKRYSSSPKEYTETEQTNVTLGDVVMGIAQTYHAESIEISDGAFADSNFELISSSDITDFDVLKGNYAKRFIVTGSKFYYIPEDATITKGTDYLTVDKAYLLGVNSNIGTFIDLVASEESNAYPTSGQHTDGYWYEYYKLLGSNGIYIGSGDMPEGCVIQIDPDGEYEGETSEGSGSGKTLIGEVTLDQNNLTLKENTTYECDVSEDLQTSISSIIEVLNDGFDVLIVEFVSDVMKQSTVASYLSDAAGTSGLISCAMQTDASTDETLKVDIVPTVIRMNEAFLDTYLVGVSTSVTVKFYTISGSSGSSSGDTSVAEEELPAVTTEDNGKVLMVVDGKWAIGTIADGNEVAY